MWGWGRVDTPRLAARGRCFRLSTICRAPARARAALLVARSGGMTVSEVAFAGRPAISVPYPFHRDRQQELNARVLERRSGAIIMNDDDRLGENLAATLQDLAGDPARLIEMG